MQEETAVIPEEEIVGDALKKVAKGGALIFFGSVAAKLFGFLKQFIVIRLLSPSDYGLFTLGITVVGLYVLASSLGLTTGAQRSIAFYWGRGEESRARGVVLSTSRILVLWTLGVTAVLLGTARPLASLFDKPDLAFVLLCLSPLVPLTVFIDALASFFLGFHRVEVKVYLQNIGLCLVTLLSVALFLGVGRKLAFLLAAVVSAHVLVSAAGLVYAYRRFPVSLRGGKAEPMGREILRFSLPLLAVAALNYLIIQTDTLMLGYFVSSDLVGMYNAAFILVQVLSVFLVSVASIYMPVASSMVARGQNREVKGLYRSATKWLFIFTLPLFLIFFLFPREVLGLLFGGVYPRASNALRLLCLGEFVHTLLGPNAMSLLAYGRSRVLMVNAALATAGNIVLNALLIPRWGIDGAAAASFISLASVNLLNSAYLYARYGVHPFGKSYVRPVINLAAVSAVLYPALSGLLRLSPWVLPVYYPFLLGVGLGLLFLGGDVEPADRVLLDALKRRLHRNGGDEEQ